MTQTAAVHSEDLERRGLHLTIFACAVICVLAAGVALLMYAVLFTPRTGPMEGPPRAAFLDFALFRYCFSHISWIDRSL